jgi:Glyoxalase/Bleomycin resistance protein/Dioxygenase superfamily
MLQRSAARLPVGERARNRYIRRHPTPAARTFQEALFKQGIPLTAFEVTDIQEEFQRLKAHGVVFSQQPVKTGPLIVAIFSDTCGNLIQIYQPPSVP